MESHSCKKNRGEGMLGALHLPNPAIEGLPEIDNDDDSLRCRHIDSLGRRCRMFVATPEIASIDALDYSAKTKRLNFAPIMPSASCGVTVPPKPLPPSFWPPSATLTIRPPSIASLATSLSWLPSNAFPGKMRSPWPISLSSY